MKTRVLATAILSFCLTVAIMMVVPRNAAQVAASESKNVPPVLINTCLITRDVQRLAGFYAHVLQMEPLKVSTSYVEFRTGTGVLALFAADAQEKYIPGSATAGQNRSAILEFRVQDPDGEYVRLRGFVDWVKGPTTQPWGTRSIYFRDPDGNLVDFFAPANSR